MINPNIPCVVVKESGTDVYGRPLAGERIKTKCNIVALKGSSVKSSVRADSSASRGRAHELISETVLLFPRYTNISFDDTVEVQGQKLRVMAVHPRYDVSGRLDHLEVGLETWV